MTDLVSRAANILLKRNSGEAVSIASSRADALLDQRDVQGCSTSIRHPVICCQKNPSCMKFGHRGGVRT